MNARLSLICSTAALALSCGNAALAQTAAPASPADSAPGASGEGDIVVTGLRASLQRAQAVKQNSSSVVESLSAEDIGKLPDATALSYKNIPRRVRNHVDADHAPP